MNKGLVRAVGKRFATVLALVAVLSLGVASAALAACANETVRALEPYASSLPDCRAYEQASTTAKVGTDILGGSGTIESSPAGEAVTFFTTLPLPEAESAGDFPTYVARRAGPSPQWRTTGLLPPNEPGGESELKAMSEDLSVALVGARNPGFERIPYIRNTLTNGLQEFGQPGLQFGVFPELIVSAITPDDQNVLFVDEQQLLPAAAPGVENVYYWHEGQIVLASLLPASEGGAAPASGALAGNGGGPKGYDAHAISTDGARIYFTDKENGRVYLRIPAESKTVSVSPGEASWLDASSDGRFALYTEAGELFRFDANSQTSQQLTQPESATSKVLGTLGISESGGDVYFAANGVLKVTDAVEGRTPVEGTGNIYDWHEGETTFIAAASNGDSPNWLSVFEPQQGSAGYKKARVTPGGQVLLFSSLEPLTGYNNSAGGNCEQTLASCQELFRYEAATKTLDCVSCNPSGNPASASAQLQSPSVSQGAPLSRNPFLTRNLSSDGGEVFLQTNEALVPEDTNGVMDVYEWEKAGAGTCAGSESPGFSTESGGCLRLLSTGRSSTASTFGDASATGGDVYVLTRQPLVSQDTDENADVYDAKSEGGLIAQNPAQTRPCEGEECRVAPEVGTVSRTPVSEAFSAPEVKTGTPSKPIVPTRAQKLKKALAACARRKKKERPRCRSQAVKRYGPIKHSTNRASGKKHASSKGGKS